MGDKDEHGKTLVKAKSPQTAAPSEASSSSSPSRPSLTPGG